MKTITGIRKATNGQMIEAVTKDTELKGLNREDQGIESMSNRGGKVIYGKDSSHHISLLVNQPKS